MMECLSVDARPWRKGGAVGAAISRRAAVPHFVPAHLVFLFLAACSLAAPRLPAGDWEEDPESEIEIQEEDAIETDRPHFTETSSTVRQARIQIETGYTFTRDEERGERRIDQSFPEALVRVGLLDWLEFRLSWNYLVRELDDGVNDTVDGARDLGLGLKFAITEQSGLLPEMAVITEMSVPTGARAFTADKVTGGFNFLYSWEVTDFLDAGGSTGLHTVAEGDDDFLEGSQSVTAGFDIVGPLGGYVEWFALFPSGAADDTPQHYANAGLTYKVTPDLQLDVRAGAGLNRDADDFFAGAGLAFRI